MRILDAMKNAELRWLKCRETGERGRTALHVAAMQGSFRLAKQVIDIFARPEKGDQIRKILYAEDGRSGLTAHQMANDIIGHTSISRYIEFKLDDVADNYASEGMFEAYEGTDWHRAFVEGDCNKLLRLLIHNSHYLLQTCYSFSVLDVAIIVGHTQVAEYVVGTFRIGNGRICWPEQLYFPAVLSFDEFSAGKDRSGWKMIIPKSLKFANVKLTLKVIDSNTSAMDLANLFNRQDIELLLKKVGGPTASIHHLTTINEQEHLGVRQSDQQFLWRLYAAGLFETEDTKPEVNRQCVTLKPSESELPEVRELMELAQEVDKCCKEWNEGFKKDLDYNFEDKSSLRFSILRWHYNCKDEARVQRVGFFLLDRIFPYDGQGRRPLHTIIDYNYDSYLEVDKIYFGTFDFEYDARGRHFSIRALSKKALKRTDIYFFPSVKYLQALLQANYIIGYDLLFHANLFYLALLFQDEIILRFYLYQEDELLQQETSQSILQMCLKKFNNPMIEDNGGRTTLHYAVNANTFKYLPPPPTSYCSIDDYCKVEELWRKKFKEEPLSPMNLNAQQDSTNRQPDLYVGRKACILMLQQAGIDLQQADKAGNIPDPSTSSDPSF